MILSEPPVKKTANANDSGNDENQKEKTAKKYSLFYFVSTFLKIKPKNNFHIMAVIIISLQKRV